MVQAGQVMTRDVISVLPESPVLDVVRLMTDREVSGIPVVDREKRLVGIVTEKDVIRLLVEEDVNKHSVQDYMTHKVMSFKEDSNILDICRFFIKSHVRRVPILDADNRLVGLISRRDVLMEIRRIKDI